MLWSKKLCFSQALEEEVERVLRENNVFFLGGGVKVELQLVNTDRSYKKKLIQIECIAHQKTKRPPFDCALTEKKSLFILERQEEGGGGTKQKRDRDRQID